MKRIKGLPACITFALFFLTSIMHAQYQVTGSEELINKMKMKTGGNVLNKVTYDDIKGSPYIFRNFEPAVIITHKNETIKLPVRYDVYANEMEVKNEDRIYTIVQPDIIKMIITDSLKFIFSGYMNNESREHSCFILQSEGNCRFLIKKEIRLQDPEKPKLYQDAKPAEFIFIKDSYFFKNGENDAVRIRTREDVLSVMTDREEEISRFMKENKIGLNKVQDVQQLVEYYNSMDPQK